MQIKTTLRFHPTYVRWLKSMKQIMAHAGEELGEENTYSLLVGVLTSMTIMEICVAVPHKNGHQSISRAA